MLQFTFYDPGTGYPPNVKKPYDALKYFGSFSENAQTLGKPKRYAENNTFYAWQGLTPDVVIILMVVLMYLRARTSVLRCQTRAQSNGGSECAAGVVAVDARPPV